MLFNSYGFILFFLPVVVLGYFYLARIDHRFSAGWLASASLFFYGYWNPAYIGLLLASIACNYSFGRWLARADIKHNDLGKKRLLMVAIGINIVLLCYYKYANFFLGNINAVAGSHLSLGAIILPLGISFFTFTQIAFLVDAYQGKVKEYNFTHYLLFVTYFPHLIAGPIIHHKEMMPQFSSPATYRINAEHFAVGLTIFVLGLSKKVLIADSLAGHANPFFNAVSHGQTLALSDAWAGALAYTLQLYFDFSGYSDMAIGLSLMFNIRLPINFDSPYKSTNIIDFWRRWHMTLSRFLRDYLYFPLGGNRKGVSRRYLNLMATMLLGGLWHGAGWTFVIWGGLHGLYLMINHGWRDFKKRMNWGDGGRLAKVFAGTITFLSVVVGWVFFRSDSLAAASSMLSSMVGMNGLLNRWVPAREALKLVIPCLMLVWFMPNVRQMLLKYKPTFEDIADIKTPAPVPWGRFAKWLCWKPSPFVALIGGIFFFVVLLAIGANHTSEFLYFQF